MHAASPEPRVQPPPALHGSSREGRRPLVHCRGLSALTVWQLSFSTVLSRKSVGGAGVVETQATSPIPFSLLAIQKSAPSARTTPASCELVRLSCLLRAPWLPVQAPQGRRHWSAPPTLPTNNAMKNLHLHDQKRSPVTVTDVRHGSCACS